MAWLAVSTVIAPMPATYAQDFYGSPQFGTPVDIVLSPDVLEKVLVTNEWALGVQMTPQERQEFTKIIRHEWDRDGGKLNQTVSQLLPAYDQLMQLPEETRRISRRANMLNFLRGLEQNAKANDAISILMLRAYRRVHPPLMAQVPFVSAEVADAFIDAYVFLNEVKSGRKAPPMSEAARTKTRLGVASDFARMSEAQRNSFVQQMEKTTSLMLSWNQMDEVTRLITRADMGAPLSPQEQQIAQQIRHQMNNHSMQMLTNELNHIAQNQQTIMGSAPYWNPSSQSWEQKGGIVTEFR